MKIPTDREISNYFLLNVLLPIKHYFLAVYHEIVMRFLEIEGKHGDRILEIGCGEGLFVRKYMATFINKEQPSFGNRTLAGIDNDMDALERAAKLCDLKFDRFSENFTSENGNIILLQADVTHGIPIRECYYDTVIVCMVMHHIHPGFYDTLLKEIFRVLVPGGKAMIIDHGKPKTFVGRLLWLVFSRHAYASNCIDRVIDEARKIKFEDPEIRETVYGWTHAVVLTRPNEERCPSIKQKKDSTKK